ncbi:MAG: PaaI family thioesterase [Lachnospiraceae bacterium]
MEKEYEFLKNRLEQSHGFMEFLPISVDRIEKGYVEAILQLGEKVLNPFGTVHGGCLFAVADSVAGTAAMTHGRYVTTISGHIHYLNPAVGMKKMKVAAQEVKAGKTILTYDVVFEDEKENVICKATLEYFALNVIKREEMNIK